MKNLLLCALTICSMCSLSAQQKFESGYYIDSSGKRTEGLIRTTSLETLNDKDAALVFKPNAEADSQNIPVTGIAEAGIAHDTKLRKFQVLLDDGNYFRDDNTEKYVRQQRREIFLNVLIEGEASLFVYDSGNGPKYFYQLKSQADAVPQQLIYKTYFEKTSIKENTAFRQQIFNDLKCKGDAFSKFSDVKYQRETFVRVINDYNKCHGGTEEITYNNDKKQKVASNLSVFAGLHNALASISSESAPSGSEGKLGYSIGFEEELLMSTRKWAFLARVEFESFKMEGFRTQTDISDFSDDVRIDSYTYKTNSFNLLIGGRYYFMPESKHRVYLDGSGGMTFPSGESSHVVRIDTGDNVYGVNAQTYKNTPNLYFSFGLGYSFSERISAEFRFDTPKGIVDEAFFRLGYSKFGVNLRYTF